MAENIWKPKLPHCTWCGPLFSASLLLQRAWVPKNGSLGGRRHLQHFMKLWRFTWFTPTNSTWYHLKTNNDMWPPQEKTQSSPLGHQRRNLDLTEFEVSGIDRSQKELVAFWIFLDDQILTLWPNLSQQIVDLDTWRLDLRKNFPVTGSTSITLSKILWSHCLFSWGCCSFHVKLTIWPERVLNLPMRSNE